MMRVFVEVREGTARSMVAVRADSICQAVSITKERFSGHDVRVVFPIEAEEFFGSREEDRSRDGNPGRLRS